MNGFEFSAIVRAAGRCGLEFRDPLLSPAINHPHSIQRQLGRESPLVPGKGHICLGEQLLARLGHTLDHFSDTLLDPGLPGIWRWQRRPLLHIARQFLAPAKHFPVTIWGHTTCWTDQCIAQGFQDAEIGRPLSVASSTHQGSECTRLRLDGPLAVAFRPSDFLWMLPGDVPREEVEFVKSGRRQSVFAAPEGRWFRHEPQGPSYAQPARNPSDVFGETYRERLTPIHPDPELALLMHADRASRSYDLFVHRDVPRIGNDFGRLTVRPAADSNQSASELRQHDRVCSHAILDLSVLNLRRLLPGREFGLAGVYSDELSITWEAQTGKIATIGVKREWFPESDQRRGLNDGEVTRLEPYLDAHRDQV